MAAQASKYEDLINAGWRWIQEAPGDVWWYYGGVGQGYRLATAWKKMKAQGVTPQEFATHLRDGITPERQRGLAAARDAVIRAAKAWVAFEDDGLRATVHMQGKLNERLARAVERLRKLEAK